MQKLSAVVITYNEEKNIRDCLESLKWADEIIIVDAFSSDKTIQIAKEYTSKIFQRNWQGYSKQRNFGLSQANNEWILFIDADERISNPLVSEMTKVIENDSNRYNGYYIPRQSFYSGKLIKHGEWYPDLKLRLIRNGKGVWCGASVHEKLVLNGRAGYFKSPIYHFTYNDITHHLEKFNRYSTLFAQDRFKRGEEVKFCQLFWRPFIRFIKGYFLRQGFRDGFPGFVIAFMQSFEVFLRYAKLIEAKGIRIYGEKDT